MQTTFPTQKSMLLNIPNNKTGWPQLQRWFSQSRVVKHKNTILIVKNSVGSIVKQNIYFGSSISGALTWVKSWRWWSTSKILSFLWMQTSDWFCTFAKWLVWGLTCNNTIKLKKRNWCKCSVFSQNKFLKKTFNFFF